MNIVLIASTVVAVTVILGALFAFLFFQLSNIVYKENYAAELERRQYNQALTAGHKITPDADLEVQLKEARILAAKQAASMDRSANVTIGNVGSDRQPTASDGIGTDPVTAVKIAQHHTWQGLIPGASSATDPAKPALAPAQTAPPMKSADQLVPGEDYPFIEITDEMAPAEVRKARIANAKAKSAAVKALRSAPAPVTIEPAAPQQAEQTESKPEPDAVTQQVVGEPVPGVDYQVIDITEDMDPADIRKARITNAKAKSAAVKAYKEAGGKATVPAPVPQPDPEPEIVPTEQQTEAISVETPANIPQPNIIEITDEMAPEDIRAARISNSKARSAYVKALKEAGIDPSTVEF
jgi:hypothetical protein